MSTNAYITPDNIRTFLLDRGSSDNFLLDAVEFSSEEIDLAMILTVDRYNTTTPILNEGYTEATFPYKMEFLLGVAGHLMRSKSINYERNSLQYTSASGTAVDDKKAKARSYLEIAEKLLGEFDTRIKSLKMDANVNGAFGFVRGPGKLVW